MKYLIDTNMLLYAAANHQEAISFFDDAVKAEWIGYSSITRLEVLGYPSLKHEDEKKLTTMLGCFEEVPVGHEVIDRAVAVRRGRKIRVPDAIIAGTALVMKATLVTRNASDFKGINGLSVLNPFVR